MIEAETDDTKPPLYQEQTAATNMPASVANIIAEGASKTPLTINAPSAV
ncbi:MAG: hypothetical protein K0R22_3199 [Sporomusa sp.]|jgi:hypothetical protein|nr:hypothetical protein [Sporomusa sp.]